MKKINDIDEKTDEGKMLIAIITEISNKPPYCGMDLDEIVSHIWEITLNIFPKTEV